jgi:hypothetical protein
MRDEARHPNRGIPMEKLGCAVLLMFIAFVMLLRSTGTEGIFAVAIGIIGGLALIAFTKK